MRTPKRFCKCCGILISPLANKEKIYCSKECLRKDYKAKRSLRKPHKGHPITSNCSNCSNLATGYFRKKPVCKDCYKDLLKDARHLRNLNKGVLENAL